MQRVIGRPAIGPKAQAQIPTDWHHLIQEEAKQRGVPSAVIVREIIGAGVRVRYPQAVR